MRKWHEISITNGISRARQRRIFALCTGICRFPRLANPFLHLQSWLERDDQFGGNIHCLPGPGVASLSRLSQLDLENPEIAKLDAALVQQRLRDAFEEALDDFPGMLLGEAGFLGDRVDDVLLGHEQSFLANARLRKYSQVAF